MERKHTNLSINARNYSSTYLKQLHKMLGAMQDKKAYAQLRHNVLSRQKGKNYQLESDRINGILESSQLSQTNPNYERLKNRAKELKELGALAFNRRIPE